MVIVLMGVSGAGKSTVGQALAQRLGWTFVDADELHVPSSVEKMRGGVGLSDADRWPWLARVKAVINERAASERPLVIACSALRDQYRRYLADGRRDVHFVFLRAAAPLLQSRLAARTGHFASADLLHSQLETLEPPADALTLDASQPVEVLVERIREALTSTPPGADTDGHARADSGS
jgi:gluconokinase